MINKKELPYQIAIATLAFGVLWLGYVYVKNLPKSTWRINNVKMYTISVSPGEEIVWTLDICRYTDKEYILTNFLRNSETGDAILINRTDTLEIKKGECKSVLQKGKIPTHSATGESRVFVRLTVRDTPDKLYPPVEGISDSLIIEGEK